MSVDPFDTFRYAELRNFFAWHTKRPAVLYHYTSTEGLIGIIKTRKMWASHVRFLNDPSELDYGTALVRRVVGALLRSSSDSRQTHVLSEIQAPVAAFEGHIDTYVLCFCAGGDILSQWRAYGERGGGYALGFKTKRVKARAKKGAQFDLCKVEYREARQVERIKGLVERGLNMLGTLGDDAPAMRKIIAVLRQLLAMYCVVFKSPAFREEREWRGVFTTRMAPSASQFRSSNGRLVPYVELAFSSDADPLTSLSPLSVIRYGPTLQPDLTERSLRLLLNGNDLKNVKVQPSSVPLRV